MVRIVLTVLAALIAALHTFGGGIEFAAPLLAEQIPPPLKTGLYACWHIVTAFLIWSSIAFWQSGSAAFHFGAVWVASAVAFLWACYFVPETPDFITTPQWLLLAPVGLLAMWSNRKSF